MLKVTLILLCLVLGIIVILLALVYWWQEKLIFFPEKVHHTYQYQFRHPHEEIFINAPGGSRIHALHFKTEQPKGAILYFHGNAGSLRTWGSLAEELAVYGYDIFMPDYRSFGKSTGRLSPHTLYHDA